MIQEPFAAGSSWIHRLDPRFRIVIAVVTSIVVALSSEFPALLTAFTVSGLLVCLAGLHLRDVLKRMLSILGFILLIWAVLPFTYEGEPFFHVGPLVLTKPGVFLSARITIKSITIVLIFISLVSTMTIATLGHALGRLYLSRKLVMLFLMTYRYIFVIEHEYQRLTTAMKIRGFRSRTNLHSYRTYAYLIGMLFVHASIRAQRVQNAMLCRGFKGQFYSLVEYKSSSQNWIFLIMMIWVIFLLIMMEIRLYG
jgi:cobalt/nickel transport system permease protein